jgi:hypothetical protein
MMGMSVSLGVIEWQPLCYVDGCSKGLFVGADYGGVVCGGGAVSQEYVGDTAVGRESRSQLLY